MKKAQALSTICISLSLVGPAAAQLPANGCYQRTYDAAHLSANPGQGVAELTLWLFDEAPGARAALLAARMADQGQGAADAVAGQVLNQSAFCPEGEAACYVECDGGWFEATALADGGMMLATTHFALGEGEGCGGRSNLAEAGAGATRYRLAAVPAAQCAALSTRYPLPRQACWGVDYAEAEQEHGVAALRLRIGAEDAARYFAVAQGVMETTFATGGRAAAADMGGVRATVPIWCSARDGLCQGAPDDGAFVAQTDGEGMLLRTAGFVIWGQDGASLDLAPHEGVAITHALRRLDEAECPGLE